MIFLWIALGILCFLLAAFFVWLAALLHTRKGHPIWKELDDTVYAHRGLHDETKPENSMAAFAAAIEEGFAFEFDLHLSSDGRLVVHHDATAKRMCGANLRFNSATFDEIRALRLPDGSQIPTFEELLALVNGRVPMLIELKNDGNNGRVLVDATLKVLKDYKGPYIIESFDPRVLIALKKADSSIARGQLCENYLRNHDAPWYMRFLLASMVMNFRAKPDFIAYNVKHRTAFPLRLLAAAHNRICFWTVRSLDDLKYCIERGQNPIFEKIPLSGVRAAMEMNEKGRTNGSCKTLENR